MWNKYQTQEEEINIDSLPDEVREEFYECLNIPFIKWLISPDRPRAKDLPRDEKGRIIVDVTKPHILEDMDYFRPVAIHFQKTGKITDLKPNGNPNSAYGKWIREEVRRCWEGYVRESDGEWIPGNFYYFLNYFPIAQTKTVVGSNKGKRIIDFPEVWDGNYLRYHYIEQAQHGGLFNREGGLNGAEISARGKTKSLSMASIMSKYFTLGESEEINRAVKVMAMAYSKEYLINDGILNKFQASLDFIATHTQFPHLLLKNSLQDMNWIMGWKNLDTGAREGTLNEASGVAVKDDVGKIRGKRLNFVIGEEFGSFSNIREIYNILLPSIREGKYAFGMAYLIGTSGEKQSDFNQATEIIYNPKGYYMYALPNVYDKPGEGRKNITFFFPEYIDRKGCYDENGNSNVTKALIEILLDRYRIKYNTTDLNTITRSIAERPITPQEALLKSRGNKFPVNELNQRLNELDANSAEFDDVFVGELVETGEGNVEFRPTADQPIRVYPIENNMTKGALEIFCMPQKDSNDRVPQGRYIASCLPEGELVSTDRGLVPISEVTLNDKLLNISGEFVNIIKIKSRIANESIYKFKLRTIYDTVSFTGEHPIFCCTPKVKYHHSKFAQRNNLPYRYKKYNFEFKKAKDVKAGDVVISPNRYRKVINFDNRWENCSRVDFNVKSPLRDKRFWWIIGLMLGDGWASNNGYSISCSFNANEKLYIDRFKEYCEDIFKRGVCFSKNYKTCKEQTFSCRDFNYFFAKNFGIGAKNKNIPEWVKYIDEEYKIALILGYLAADGCATGDSIEFVSISKKLLIDIQDILFSIGINCGITKLRNKKNNCKIRGKIVNQQEAFHLRIAKIGLTKMCEWDKDDIKLKRLTYKYDENNAKKDIKKVWFSDDLNYIYFTIDSIEESHYDGVVYNFECDTHTYMCGHIPTHNCDPIDQDVTTDSTSLYSTFVLDLFTDNVVAEYTGRKEYAEQNYEVSRLLCIFYNCKLLYESNLKGTFSYFSKMGCLNMLADTPEYLQDKELLKLGTIGNTTKGVRATKAVNNYADDLTREWMIQQETVLKKDEDGKEIEVTRKKLFSLRNRAFIMEAIRYNNYENFDRIRSFGLLMLYREQFRIAAGGNVAEVEETSASNLAFDPFFTRIFNKGR